MSAKNIEKNFLLERKILVNATKRIFFILFVLIAINFPTEFRILLNEAIGIG